MALESRKHCYDADVLPSHENGSSLLVYKIKIMPQNTSEKGTKN